MQVPQRFTCVGSDWLIVSYLNTKKKTTCEKTKQKTETSVVTTNYDHKNLTNKKNEEANEKKRRKRHGTKIEIQMNKYAPS